MTKKTNSNDHEKPAEKRIVQGTEYKDSMLKKAATVFFSEDLDSIGNSIVDDYIKPRVEDFAKDSVRRTKEMIVDSISSAAEVFFLGDSKRKKKSSTGEYNGQKVNVTYYTAYDSDNGYYYKKEADDIHDAVFDEQRRSTRLKRVRITDYKKAQEVLTMLIRLSKQHPYVTVAQYYQLVGMDTSKLDFYYGWKSFAGVRVISVNGGYLIDLPKPIEL